MGLLSFFRRRTNAADAPTRSLECSGVPAAIHLDRRRRCWWAGHRISALFENQPRPIPVGIPDPDSPTRPPAAGRWRPPATPAGRVAAGGRGSGLRTPRSPSPTVRRQRADGPRRWPRHRRQPAAPAIPSRRRRPRAAATGPAARRQPKPEAGRRRQGAIEGVAGGQTCGGSRRRTGGRFIVQVGRLPRLTRRGCARRVQKLEKLGLEELHPGGRNLFGSAHRGCGSAFARQGREAAAQGRRQDPQADLLPAILTLCGGMDADWSPLDGCFVPLVSVASGLAWRGCVRGDVAGGLDRRWFAAQWFAPLSRQVPCRWRAGPS